ncbi:MAG: DUF2062 domain-containing protein [Proteobacteria bacterium]|nr:DUF2062 domain-containing protein [Pseudomonadota bacterium]
MSKKLIQKLIKRFIPNFHELRKDKNLQLFHKFLHDPNLWHLNRYSVATAFSTGLFAALIPVPFQMLLAAALAIFARANILISMALAWVSNPFTTPPLLYLEYKIGSFLLGMPAHHFTFEPTYEWIKEQFHVIGTPLLLGCFVLAIVFAILGNLLVRIIWRISVIIAWKKRIHRLKARKRLMQRIRRKKNKHG